MYERRINIFLWAFGHMWKEKIMMSIFYWLAEREVIFCPEKALGLLKGVGGT